MGLLTDLLSAIDARKRVLASNLRDPVGAMGLLGGTLADERRRSKRETEEAARRVKGGGGLLGMSVMGGDKVTDMPEWEAAGLAPMGLLGAIKMGGVAEPNVDAVEAARRAFGQTFNPREAGYMLPDGSLLDLSGRHYGAGYKKSGGRFVPQRGQPDYLANSRNVDHRELPDEVRAIIGGEGQSAGMRKFMEEANALRLAPQIGFETSFVPTSKQLKSIADQWRYSPDPLAIDVVHPKTGETLGSTEMARPSAERIRAYIANLLKDYAP